ncbi:ferredoxin [Rhabdothermincola salaria]|uniref:ferredoxin n=1 Tax=Rhabdothermincola salaria TaxID=2903142 RepID=UPI001E53B8C0|nr:ferredoxin [Rhabdothermincola salaria]
MDVTIHIDRTQCIGSGQCVYVAPRAFEQDDDAKAVVHDQRGEPEDKVVRAVTACPVGAITLRVGSSEIGAQDLRDWAHAAHLDDPLVELLGELGDDHHRLHTALDQGSGPGAGPGAGPGGGLGTVPAALAHDPERLADFVRQARTHLLAEKGAYAAIAERVDPRLAETFGADLDAIARALDELEAGGTDTARRERALIEVGRALREHIRLEETVLFPVAMAASVNQPQ